MLPKVDVTLDAETLKQNKLCAEILQVLKIVRPEWQIENIQQKILTGGITNNLLAYYIAEHFEDDVVLVRIEGLGTEQMANRKQEQENLQTLYAAGIGPPLYCVFNNGMTYGYIHGETLNIDTEREDTVRLLIAKEMARLHSVEIPGLEQTSGGASGLTFKLMAMAPDGFPENPEKQKRYTDNLPPKAELQKELKWLWDYLSTLGSPLLFCHNDLVPDNIIYNREKGSVQFIDYEWSMYNYEHFDIGMHFVEYTGLHKRDASRYPDKPYQLTWLRYYLECKVELAGGSPKDVTDRDVVECYVKVNKFALVCYFMSGVWGLVQSRFSALDFDYLGFGIERIGEYLQKKEEFLALKFPE